MYSQIQLLLKLFQECVNENIGQEPSFYRRLTDALAILLDFFHAEGKVIVLFIVRISDYKALPIAKWQLIQIFSQPTQKSGRFE